MREQVGTCQKRVDVTDNLGMLFSGVRRHPPAFTKLRDRALDGRLEATFVHGGEERLANGVDPQLACDIRLALFVHRRKGRHGRASDEFDFTAIAFFKDDLVDIGHKLGRCPVHLCHGQRATMAVGGCLAAHTEHAGARNRGRYKKFLHDCFLRR